MRIEEAPTKAELWEQVISLTEKSTIPGEQDTKQDREVRLKKQQEL